MTRRPPRPPLFPTPPLFRSEGLGVVAISGRERQHDPARRDLDEGDRGEEDEGEAREGLAGEARRGLGAGLGLEPRDRKSTRLNSSHANISYAVFCLKKKN